MSDDELSHAIRMRVVYDDLPDLIEVETKVVLPGWSAVSRAYTGPTVIVEQADMLQAWCTGRAGESRIEFGGDTGIGWTCLRFYAIDAAGHVVCHLRLATGTATDARDEEAWRLSVEMPTEPGLIERFTSELRHLAESLQGEAVLQGVRR
jgi:hypothetical protein